MSETFGWIIGLGIVTMALFPFALPGIALTLAAALPLLLLAIPVALVAAIVALSMLLLRGVGRAIGTIRAEKPPGRIPQSP
jgi:hypothetical protein